MYFRVLNLYTKNKLHERQILKLIIINAVNNLM